MPNRRCIAIAVLAIAVLSACGQARPAVSSTQPLSLPPGQWSARLTQSGGFASVLLALEISSDGRLVFEDRHSGRSASQQLSPQTMTELRALIAKTSIPRTGTPSPTCLDCFIYECELSSEAGTTRIHADDSTIGNSGAEALIRFLGELRDAALKAQP